MAKKKYIKDSKGVTVSVTTDTLGLEKPLLNENYDIDVHNRNMDKIDEDLKPIDDSYIIELFQHDGDTTNPRDYYTKVEADEKFATKEEVNNALNKANEAFQRGDNVKTQLVGRLISEGLNVSTNQSFEELIGTISLGKKSASGSYGDISYFSSATYTKITIPINTDFIANKIVVTLGKLIDSDNRVIIRSGSIDSTMANSEANSYSFYYYGAAFTGYMYVTNINNQSFDIYINSNSKRIKIENIQWYAYE